MKYSENNPWQDRELKHGDYFLRHDTGWFHTKEFTIRVICHEDKCFIEVMDHNGNSLSQTTTFLKGEVKNEFSN